MRDLSKDFYEKMNNRFETILNENEQFLFIAKDSAVLEMDYSRVFYNCLFEIFKRDKKMRSVKKVESDDFDVCHFNDVSGGEQEVLKNAVTFHLYKDGKKADLTKNQYERILIDSCGNLFKIDHQTNRAVPADADSGFTVKIL